MDKIIGFIIIWLMIGIYFILFILNKKTPLPKGCEDLKKNDEHCQSCSNITCQFHKKGDD